MKNRRKPPAQQRISKRTESEELANGLDPATDDSIDSDGDGWADWKEQLAGSNLRKFFNVFTDQMSHRNLYKTLENVVF